VALRAGIYARISSDRDGDNLAISRQLADCEQLAEQKGWQVVERLATRPDDNPNRL
jgi:site-specific DNA recombinase